MAGLGRLGKIITDAARNPMVKNALQNPKARQAGGLVVDRAAALADKATKGKHQEKIRRAREEAHRRLQDHP